MITTNFESKEASLRARIQHDFEQFGIEARWIGDDNGYGEYGLDDYYPLKYIMYFLRDKKYLPKLEALLSQSSDEDLLNKNTSALMWAGGHGLTYEKLQLLQDRKSFIATHINDRGPQGMTALHYAAQVSNDVDSACAIRLLVEWGADVNAQDDSLWTPLHIAACTNKNNDHRWRALYECGIDGSLKTDDGRTALSIQEFQDALDAW